MNDKECGRKRERRRNSEETRNVEWKEGAGRRALAGFPFYRRLYLYKQRVIRSVGLLSVRGPPCASAIACVQARAAEFQTLHSIGTFSITERLVCQITVNYLSNTHSHSKE